MPALAHYGIGLAAKRINIKIPLWALLIAASFMDIMAMLIPTLPLWVTHSLLMAIIYSSIAILLTTLITYYYKSKNKQTNSKISFKKNFGIGLIIGFCVLSHWILDFIGWPMVFMPDYNGVPLLFDDNYTVGLGLYSTWAGAIVMDFGVFIIGFLIYFYTLKKIKKNKL